jgi:hypothetical protein
MRYTIPYPFLAVMLLASGTASAQAGLSYERAAGLGLRHQAGGPALAADWAFGGEAAQVWQTRRSSDYALYGGARDAGLRPAESYLGIVYALPRGWGSSLEAGHAQESPIAPRRLTLTGQVHSALSDGRMLSVGLKYRVYDADAGSRFGAAGESTIANGYTLAPYRVPGAALAPSYQLQFSYQHSAASTFGLALGRDVETFTPYYEAPGSGPRQFTFTGQHWLTPSWALSYDVLSQDAASPLRLQGLRLGVRYRF